MKFTKEQASKELVAQLTKNGETLHLSERSISEQLDTLMPVIANDEMECSDFVSKCLPLFTTANNNVRNDVSAGIKAFKDKNNPVDPKPSKQVVDNTLEDRIKKLEEELTKEREEKEVNVVRQSLRAKMESLGIDDKEWLDNFFTIINVDKAIDVEKVAKDYLEFYNKSKAVAKADVTPGKGSGSGSSENEKMMDAIKRAGAVAKSRELSN